MRIIDLHCYPGTKDWIACQGPYVEALAKYWKRDWSGKPEDEVISEFTDAGVDACLVALDLETTIGTRPVGNDYVHAMWLMLRQVIGISTRLVDLPRRSHPLQRAPGR